MTGHGLLWMCGSGTHCVALLTTCMDVKVKAWNTKLNYVILHHTHTHSGVWNVPFISSAILFSGTWLRTHRYDLPTFTSEQWEPDMAFAAWMREKVPCYVCVCVLGGREQEHGVQVHPGSVTLPTFCVHNSSLALPRKIQ